MKDIYVFTLLKSAYSKRCRVNKFYFIFKQKESQDMDRSNNSNIKSNTSDRRYLCKTTIVTLSLEISGTNANR